MKQVILDVKKQYAIPIHNRENLHLIEDVFTIDGQLFFETLLLEIRGKCISFASFTRKENIRLGK